MCCSCCGITISSVEELLHEIILGDVFALCLSITALGLIVDRLRGRVFILRLLLSTALCSIVNRLRGRAFDLRLILSRTTISASSQSFGATVCTQASNLSAFASSDTLRCRLRSVRRVAPCAWATGSTLSLLRHHVILMLLS